MQDSEIRKLKDESVMVKVGIEKVTSSFTLLVVLIIALLILVFFLINAEQTARRRFEDHMEALASTDVLTGLQNRRAFDAKLDEEYRRAVRYGTSLSLIMLDVDRFKDYNDTFGHPAGDEVLRTVGRLLKLNTRNTDFPARYGGEEFAILVPQSHA
jgi:PleD family two-component response regulator